MKGLQILKMIDKIGVSLGGAYGGIIGLSCYAALLYSHNGLWNLSKIANERR